MRITFSRTEFHDLSKAWVLVSIAFAIALGGGLFYVRPNIDFLLGVIIAAVTVGTGFLLHELGHKVVAQRYGCWAEFRADNTMLLVAVITSFFGFVFAAPGAVMITGHVGKERNGKISIAGPLVNIILALGFMVIGVLFPQGFLGKVFAFGFMINAWLAIFNMLPIFILDGKKVWDWNKIIYAITMGFAIALLLLRPILPLQSVF